MTPNLLACSLIRDIPDFPQPGIIFKDITPVLQDPKALAEVVDKFCEYAAEVNPDVIVAIESRGFMFGAPVAVKLGKSFVPVRKIGKLPHDTIKCEYALEYGTNTVEMHRDAIKPGQTALIIDDLLATGGTAAASARLVEELGGRVVGLCFLVELDFLKGRDNLRGYEIKSLIRC